MNALTQDWYWYALFGLMFGVASTLLIRALCSKVQKYTEFKKENRNLRQNLKLAQKRSDKFEKEVIALRHRIFRSKTQRV